MQTSACVASFSTIVQSRAKYESQGIKNDYLATVIFICLSVLFKDFLLFEIFFLSVYLISALGSIAECTNRIQAKLIKKVGIHYLKC